jgi:type IV pilus assembly protein PilC
MSIFRYVAKEKTGKTVTGTIDMTTEAEAVKDLHKREWVVISIKLEKKKLRISGGKNIKLDDIVIFSRQLATLIDAGIPLVQALGILSEQIEHKHFQIIVAQIKQDIEAGMSMPDALSKHPQVFSELFINMVRAGEASGMLNDILERLATYLEKTASLIRKIQSGLIYPTVVVIMATIITAILLLKVVPTFKGIFEMLGGQLPLPTMILILISDVLRKYVLILIVVLVALTILFKRYISTEKGRYKFDKKKLEVPILGVLFRKVAIAKFSRTFSTLVKSGVPILNTLDIVGRTSGNKVIEESIRNCRQAIRDGEPIAQPLANSGVFPPMVTRMISIGEKTGQLEHMLSKIADFYDEQVDTAVAGLVSLIEPMVIAFLGVVIGGIVIALFLPIFKITELIAR